MCVGLMAHHYFDLVAEQFFDPRTVNAKKLEVDNFPVYLAAPLVQPVRRFSTAGPAPFRSTAGARR